MYVATTLVTKYMHILQKNIPADQVLYESLTKQAVSRYYLPLAVYGWMHP